MSLSASCYQTCEQQLRSGLDQSKIHYSDQQIEQWLGYLGLLNKWNKAYNLTSVRDPIEMVSRHLLDSLSLVPFVEAEQLIDVGTGPGLPGIPLAIAFPEKHFSLLDSNGKRTRFLQQVKLELKLENIAILNGRVEDHQPDVPYQAVLSRAFASLADMINWTSHLCAAGGVFMAMKGQYPEAEINDLPDGFIVTEINPLHVPGSAAERHLVKISSSKA